MTPSWALVGHRACILKTSSRAWRHTRVQSTVDHRESFQREYRLRRHNGEFRWVFDTGVPRFNADGSFAGYIGSCLDVTERNWPKKRSPALAAS